MAEVAAAEAPKVLRKIKGIGPAIDDLFALREKKKALAAEIVKLEAEYDEIEEALTEKLKAEGTDSGKGKSASVSFGKPIFHANVTDWDAFYKYIKRTGYFHLMQRRSSDAACAEVYESKGALPGTTPFFKRRLNLRTL